jgi:hypothetical protein
MSKKPKTSRPLTQQQAAKQRMVEYIEQIISHPGKLSTAESVVQETADALREITAGQKSSWITWVIPREDAEMIIKILDVVAAE